MSLESSTHHEPERQPHSTSTSSSSSNSHSHSHSHSPSQTDTDTGTPSPADPFVTIPTDPDRVYTAVIEDNNRVCEQCCARIRETLPFPFTVGNAHGDYVRFIYYDRPDSHESNTPQLDTVYYEQPTIPGRSPRAYPPTRSGAANELRGARHCWNCGDFDPQTPPTRTTNELQDIAPNVSMTLTEYGINHDWPLLCSLIPKLKRSSTTNGDDHEVLKHAVSLAIQRAQRQSHSHQ